MSLMTGNIGFQQYKQKTKRTVKVPGNVRDTIPIHSIAEDGIFEIEPGEDTRLFDRVYLLEDSFIRRSFIRRMEYMENLGETIMNGSRRA